MSDLGRDSALPGRDETIAALATAKGRGALAILRVSGPDVRRIAAAVLDPFEWMPGRSTLATLRTPGALEVVDRVIATAYGTPRSFTGEDLLEITTHGGTLVPALALAAVLAAGAREATPGEFTRRAVANGKLDLLQAEAVADLVDAHTVAMHRSALHQLDGGLSRRITALRECVVALEALLAYEIDFPEEDDGPLDRAAIGRGALELVAALDALLSTAHAGEIVREGAIVVLAGPPNSGKSSLFNALLGRERAIVTEHPGTTRDALEAMIEVRRWPVRLVDTAGLREHTGDPVERLGIEVAHRYLQRADLVLVCAETGAALGEATARVATLASVPAVRVRTKIDLVAHRYEHPLGPGPRDADLVSNGDVIEDAAVSAITGAGLAELVDRIAAALDARHPETEGAEALLTRERHRRAVEWARDEVQAFREAWEGRSVPAPVAAVHLQTAGAALEGIIGVVERDDVLDQLFRTFCIGK